MPTVISKLARAGRQNDLTWRYLFNLNATLAYKLNRIRPDGEAARVLDTLNRDGVAMTSADTLLGNLSCFDELSSAISQLEVEHTLELAEARNQADDRDAIGNKTFVLQLLGEQPLFDPNSIYARFALQTPLLQIANAYFGMFTRLRYYDVWHTLTTRGDARESQLWHQDREDRQILKVFVYFSDVDEGAGPFTYAAGTHSKGLVRRNPDYHLEGHVRRTTDEQMADVLPADRWVKAVGPKGTIVFADTRGFHKGGLARMHDRLMYVCMFTSQASQSKELMRRVPRLSQPREKDLAFALMVPKGQELTSTSD